MDHYTDICDERINDLHPWDEDYEEKLKAAASRFRPFDEALDPFLLEHDYTGDIADTQAKIEFLQKQFKNAGMTPPREIARWYEEHRDIRRNTAFMLCFAFGLGIGETDDFFRRVFCRERCFDCHCMEEVVYYFCIRNAMDYAAAEKIIARVPSVTPGKVDKGHDEILYTGTIIKEVDRITDPEDLIRFLNDNRAQFAYNNATAYEYIRTLWNELVAPDGLLNREAAELKDEDAVPARRRKAAPREIRPMDALTVLLGVEKKSIAELSNGGRTLSPILKHLPKATRDSFPDLQGIGQILRGEHVSYERVRKWLILLSFSVYWIRKALAARSYNAGGEDKAQCMDWMDNCLLDAGYMALYSGNPFDWLFLFAMNDEMPLPTFRDLWNILVAETQEEQMTSKNTDPTADDV